MPTNKTPFTFHLDDDLLQKIKFVAKTETRSTSNLLEHLCKICVNDYEKTHGTIDINE